MDSNNNNQDWCDWLIDWLICRNPQARWCALGPSLSMSIVVKNVWLIDGWIVIIKCVVWLINWLYVYLGKIVCTGAKTEHVHCCENVLNVIDWWIVNQDCCDWLIDLSYLVPVLGGGGGCRLRRCRWLHCGVVFGGSWWTPCSVVASGSPAVLYPFLC